MRVRWNKVAVLCAAILFAAIPAFGDVAPDPGYTNVPANLVLEWKADLSDYRFVLESPLEVEEIKLNAGGRTVIEATGRGGAARYVKLIAIPPEDLSNISGDLNESLLETLVRQKAFKNVKVLFAHNFQATIPITAKAGWENPVYEISLSGDVISAEHVRGGSKSESGLTPSVWLFIVPVVIAGCLLAGGFTIAGIWLLRRKKKFV